MPPLPRLLPCFLLVVLLLAISLSACGKQEAFQAYQEGQHALAQNKHQDALAHFDHALTLDSSYAKAYLARGQMRWQQQQHEQALPDLNRAIEFDPYLIWAYYLRGASLIALQRYEQSLADFDRFLAADEVEVDDRVRAHRWRGIALLNMERPNDALVDFSECISLQPDLAFHRKERAEIYEGLGQIDNAIADYTAFLDHIDQNSKGAKEVQHRIDSLQVLR